MKKIYKAISVMLCLCIFISLSISASAEDSSFEKTLSAFPESYKVYLRELHKEHPNWEFTALKTGIKWDTAVEQESKYGRSLVSNASSYTDYFKSKASGDYNYTTGRYIEKDGGFVTANKLAISFFMDPRNSLTEENIFQFEDLSFDKSFNTEAIGVILAGSYCPPEYKDDPTKYYKVIYDAGKTYNVNPCYLAAKIKNEIGTGSGSVSGKNSKYPEIYNFYNIGASDGIGAIERGLEWASKGTTYNRPWNSAKKSIIGGAEFIAANYIAEGQYTGYLQKFNVNPKSTYGLYNHQYMTNISGSMTQGYSTYKSYLLIGLIDNHFKFSIPVFDSMPGQNDNSGTIYPTDAQNQRGQISVSVCNVRKGPSTNNGKYAFQLSEGTSVTILDCVKTDSNYYDSILSYPFWYQIKFTYDSTSYKGYVPASFVNLTSSVNVDKSSSYKPKYQSTNSALSMNLVSYDTRYAEITDNNAIKFLAKGNVSVGFYDSVGRFRLVNYKVSDKVSDVTVTEPTTENFTPEKISSLSASDIAETSFTLSWSAAENAKGYRVYLYNDKTSSYDVYLNTTKTSCSFTDLKKGTEYKVKVKAYNKDSDGQTVWGSASSVLTVTTTVKAPAAPKDIKQKDSSTNSLTLSWTKVTNANGYEVYMYDSTSKSYKSVASSVKNECSVYSLKQLTTYKFKIKAYLTYNGKKYKSSYSKEFSASTGPLAVTEITQSATTKTSYQLNWNAVKGAAGYMIYTIDLSNNSYKKLCTVKGKTSYKISKLDSGTLCAYSIIAYSESSGATFNGSYSDAFLATTLPGDISSVSQSSTTSTGYTLKWSKVKNASGYYVYKENEKGEFKKIATASSNELKLTSLKSLSSAKYKVRAFIKCNGKNYYSSYSSVFKAYAGPAKVTGLKKTAIKGGGYKLSWNKVSSVSGYKVYTYDSKTKKYSCLITTQSTSVNISSSSSTVYAIRAYKKINNTTYYGDYSSKLTVK